MKMSCTERVLAAVNFRKPDRLPMWDGYFGDFIKSWQEYKKVDSSVPPSLHYGNDVSVQVADECFFPTDRGLVKDEGDYGIWKDGWGRTIRTGKNRTYFMETLDSVLKKPSDLDDLAFEPAGLETRYGDFEKRVENAREDGLCVFAKVGGIYIRSHFLRGEDKLLMDMALDEGFCDELFDRVAKHLTDMALETLKRSNTWETGLWVYDDMASTFSPMFSPGMFERYFLDRYKKLIDNCKAAGCRHFYLHSDGNIGPMFDMLLDAGFEGFNPLEPRSGLHLVKLREKYGKKMIFFGGVCNSLILPGGDKKEIEAHVRPLAELGRQGGVILGAESIGDDVSPEVYDFYKKIAIIYGNYSGK